MNTARQYTPLDKPDIIQTIQAAGVDLQRKGRDYWSPCPFHKDKTPSFKVSPERQSFYCFGCSEHGDVIDFLQRLHGLSYPDALKHLGIDSGQPYRPDPAIERRRKLRAAFEKWRRVYYNSLADDSIRLHQLRFLAKKKPPQGEIGWAYAETISRLPMIDYRLDLLSLGNDEDIFKIYSEVNNR